MFDADKKEAAAFFGVSYAHAVSSGTAAIKTALRAAGIGSGDAVISTCFTFIAPIEAIVELGAVPVLAEMDDTYNIDPADVEHRITARTKAILAIPMWAACDMDALRDIADRRGLVLLEDAAQCFGGTHNGQYTGTLGAIGSFSFDFGKTMTCGEGGLVVTDSETLYRRAAEYSDHGHMHDPTVPRGQDPRRAPGFNFRMSELTGAVARAQLARVPDVLRRQRRNVRLVMDQLADSKRARLRRFTDAEGQIGSWLAFQLPDADLTGCVLRNMERNGIGSSTFPESHEWHFAGFWKHLFERFPEYDTDNLAAHWPRSADLVRRSIGVGIRAGLTDTEATALGAALRAAVDTA